MPQATGGTATDQRSGAGLAIQGSLDPDRAEILLTGKTRTSTLKRYLSYYTYRQWRLWLGEAKLGSLPGRPVDLVDCLQARRDEPCGRSVPGAIIKAVVNLATLLGGVFGPGRSLVKVWASLRWSDLQATISAELSFVEGRWLQWRGPG